LRDQNAHANNEDGPEKIEIMTRVDEQMAKGSETISQKCFAGSPKDGVHYGITIWEYLGGTDKKHPQAATLEELENTFRSEFFATSPCVFNEEANTSGYNGANKLADTQTETGKLALSNNKASHVAMLKVSKDAETGKSRISEVRMLPGMPQDDMLMQGHSGGGANSMNVFRSRQLRQNRGAEPAPEPLVQHESVPMQQVVQTSGPRRGMTVPWWQRLAAGWCSAPLLDHSRG